MTSGHEHVKALEQIREIMVAARRRFAAKSYADEVVEYQLKIDAIQRAIDDEKRLSGSTRTLDDQ